MGIIAIIVDRLARRNPIEYARKLGVKVGNDCRFTGNPGWGSEPWLIQIGNHVFYQRILNLSLMMRQLFYFETQRNIRMFLSLHLSLFMIIVLSVCEQRYFQV